MAFLCGLSLAGCFDGNAGGPGLEPPLDVPGFMGSASAGSGAFGNTGDDQGGGSPAPTEMDTTDPLTGTGGTGTSTTDTGDADAPPADAGATDGGVDAETDAETDACADIEAAFETALSEAQACEAGDTCRFDAPGAACSGGLLFCNVAYRDGSDIAAAVAFDQAYRDAGCGKDTPMVCASCIGPAPASCVDGVCTVD